MNKPNYIAEHLYGQNRESLAEQCKDYRRVGCEGYELFTFKDGSMIEVNPHWKTQQIFTPTGWNITPRK